MKIHNTAIIGENVILGNNVEIGPYAIIEDGVSIGDNSVIEPHARLCKGSKIGNNCTIGTSALIAGAPQDLHFDQSTPSFVEIGDGTVVREFATVHRATVPNAATSVGKNCLIMAYGHIAHDVKIMDCVIQGCFSAIAGHCVIGRDVFVSGGVMIHQKMRIGEGSMLSGNSAFSMDIPPFVNGFLRNAVAGLNLIGMRRRGMSSDEISDVKRAYHAVYQSNSARKNAISALESGLVKTEAGIKFLKFFTSEGRHFCTPRERENAQ